MRMVLGAGKSFLFQQYRRCDPAHFCRVERRTIYSFFCSVFRMAGIAKFRTRIDRLGNFPGTLAAQRGAAAGGPAHGNRLLRALRRLCLLGGSGGKSILRLLWPGARQHEWFAATPAGVELSDGRVIPTAAGSTAVNWGWVK